MRLVQTLSAMALCAALAACNSGASSSAPAADAAKAPADAAAAPAAAPAAAAPAAAAPAAAPEPAAPASGDDAIKATEAELKKGMAYGDFRKAVLAQGWQPVPEPQCKANVVGANYEKVCKVDPGLCKVCDDLPELEACSGDAHCLVKFKHPSGANLQATGYGEAQYWSATGKDSGFQVTQWEFAPAQAH